MDIEQGLLGAYYEADLVRLIRSGHKFLPRLNVCTSVRKKYWMVHELFEIKSFRVIINLYLFV